jgi:hypothetical protein
MAGLLEIANVPRMVNVLGKDVDVFGISGRAVAALMARFPAVGKMFSGIEVQKEDLYKMGPEVIAALIAAGCGKPGDPAAEEFAANLGVGDQLDLLDEILRLSGFWLTEHSRQKLSLSEHRSLRRATPRRRSQPSTRLHPSPNVFLS